MKYRRNKVHLLYIMFTVLFVFFISLRENQSKEIDGDIVVIFNNEISEYSLEMFITSFNTPIEVINHIEDYALLRVKDSGEGTRVLSALQESNQIKVAQINDSISLFKISEDTYADSQWALENPGWYTQIRGENKNNVITTKGMDLDVTKSWEYLNKSKVNLKEVVVAIIDTGIDYTHPDLAENMWVNENEISNDGIDNDNNGYVDDVYGWDFYNDDSSVCHYKYNAGLNLNMASPEDRDDHGTHCAGIIAAVANNNIGIAGVASNVNVKIMALKINGGKHATGDIASAIEAIKYATMMGAEICNISWGSYQYNEALEIVMRESDMLFIAAAGNSGSNNNNKPIYPASYELDNLISVTFVDSNGRLLPLSNYGATTVDFAAPGQDIYSTIVGSYESMSGSSMAAPHISAIAAMLYSSDENLYPENIKEIIYASVKPIEYLEKNMIYPGIPSAYKALLEMDNLKKDSDTPKISFDTIYNKSKLIVPIYTEDKGGSGIRVIKWMIGNRELSDFNRGTAGTSVQDNQVTFAKATIYSFYISDYAGNDTVDTYQVLDDITAPQITASYTVSNSYETKIVKVNITDAQSGLKKVEYMKGKKKAGDFLPASAGTEIEIVDGFGSFKVKKEGVYSIYAVDYRGNNTVTTVSVKVIKATDIMIAKLNKTLTIGSRYTIKKYVKPVNTTDKISFVSSNLQVATVNSKGIVSAKKAGMTVISARTSSGITAICEITVEKP